MAESSIIQKKSVSRSQKERVNQSLETAQRRRVMDELETVQRQLQSVIDRYEPTKEWFDLYLTKVEGVNYYRNIYNQWAKEKLPYLSHSIPR